MFEGMTDWHSHILPGVDDGIKTMEESLAVLRTFDELGVKRVWLTPHIMEDYPNETSALKDRFEELKESWTGKVELRLAAENMLDSLFSERIDKNDVLPIGEEGNHLLVETSYYTPPMGLYETIDKIRRSGYFPVLAHPERYRYMEAEDYRRLKGEGVLFQVNMLSLSGAYGDSAARKMAWLLSEGMADVIGSDIHRLDVLIKHIDLQSYKQKYLESLMTLSQRTSLYQ